MTLHYDIIALDVDGTLLNESHKLTPPVREAVREAAAHGAEIVLCTGRGPVNTFPVLDELGFAGTIITHNGAATVDAATRKVLHQDELDRAELVRFLAHCRERGYHFDINTAFTLMTESLTPQVKEMYARHRIEPVMREPSDPLPDGLVKLTVFGGKPEMDELDALWSGWKHGLRHIRSGDFFIDVHHPQSSKGNALRSYCAERGVDRSRVMAVGNYYNDIDMLEFAGLGIAVANSPDRVKAAAQIVAPSNEEDGVACALREHGWD